MKNSQFGNFDEFNNTAITAARELESINTKVIEKLTRTNMALFNSGIELNRQYFSTFGEAKGVQELLTEQLKLTSEFNGKFVASVKEATDILVESKDEYQAWLENGIKTATTNAQSVADAIKPAV